jgi:hypothetical protein
MTTLRSIGYLTLFVVALAGWTRTGTRKEMLRLQVSSASGAKVGVHLRTRGLYVMREGGMFGQPATTDTTMSTPANVTLFGVGDADLEAVEPTTRLVVRVTQLSQNAPPARRLTGRVFRVTHAAVAEPYQVRVAGRNAQSP